MVTVIDSDLVVAEVNSNVTARAADGSEIDMTWSGATDSDITDSTSSGVVVVTDLDLTVAIDSDGMVEVNLDVRVAADSDGIIQSLLLSLI
jgi:hypothetical protein